MSGICDVEAMSGGDGQGPAKKRRMMTKEGRIVGRKRGREEGSR
jgi:hypothetical protein